MNINAIAESTNGVEHSQLFRSLPWRAKIAARIFRNGMPIWFLWIYLATSLINGISCIFNPSWMQFSLFIMFLVFAVQETIQQGTRYLFSLSPSEIDTLKIKRNTVEQDAAANP